MPSSWSELRMYRTVFEHCPHALLVIDDDGRVVLSNQRARALSELGLDELFRSRDPAIQSFRAKLRVGWQASSELRIAAGEGGPRLLLLEGRGHGSFSVISIRTP